MSSLVSMQVLGIRSFGPDEEDVGVIKFLSPITLILGQNGCGKTTLIESLKFATCGDVPDNTNRGRDFLHDPHLADLVEVRGVVKLKFKNKDEEAIVVTRPLQVSQKLKNLEFKRLDSALKITYKNGESVSLSSRCTDIDNLVTTQLGVSKAILNNVIFCHQEDSSWPLDEGKKVKERFDAIFDAKKYNACLENIRKLKKESDVGLKVMKVELNNLTERKNEAGNKRAQLSDTESRLTASRDRVKSFKAKLLPVTTRLQEIAEKEDNIGKLQTEYGTYKAKLSSAQDMIKEYKSRIQCEFNGTDEELQDAVNNFQEELSVKQSLLAKLDRELIQVDSEMKQKQTQANMEQTKLNQLNRDSDRYKEWLESRNKSLVDISETLSVKNVSASELNEDPSQVDRTIQLIEIAVSEKQDDVSEMKSENEAIINQLQGEVDSLREEKVKIESLISHKKQSIVTAHKECDKLKKTLDDIDKSADSLRKLDMKLEKVKREFDDLNSSYNFSKIESEMKEKTSERINLEKDLAVIEKDVLNMQKTSGLKAEIDVQKDVKNSKDTEIKKMLRRHSDSLQQLLGEVPEQSLKLKFQACQSRLSDDIRGKRDELKIAEKQITSLEIEKKHLLDKLRSARQGLTSDECLIDQECGNKDYDTCIAELSAKVQELQDQKGMLSSSEYMFKRYVQKLEQQDPCCPLCHRDFTGEDEVGNLVVELNLKMREVPSKLRSNKEKLEEYQEKYKKLLQLKPVYDKLLTVKNEEIPKLQGDLETAEKKLERAQLKVKELQEELSEPLSNEELAKSIQNDVTLLEQYMTDVKKLEKEIQKLEAKLPAGSQRCSLDEALEEQELLRSKLSNIRKSFDTMQVALNAATSKKQKLQEEKNCIQEQQMKISGNVQMRAQLLEKLKENEALLTNVQAEIDKNTDNLVSVSRKLEDALFNIKEQTESNSRTLQEAVSKLKLIEQRFKDVMEIQKQIKDYEKSGGLERIATVQKNLATLKRTCEKLLENKEAIQSQQEDVKSHLLSQKTRERELEDNVKLRSKLVEEKDLTEKIKKLKLVIGSLDYVSITVEKNKLRSEEESINRERAHAEGRQRELENNISSIKKELDKDIYKNADKNYKDKLIQIKVEEAAGDDLSKFYEALNWALNHFHKEKMKAINSTIRDLWRQIYQGNDIDSIEIKADDDNPASVDKRRTYNYRVVQKKNGVEMDMRGRCSAGQKVLACLIIRMALAETFSTNCKVLALDEPTTNLDEANIHSLSEALVQIVSQRSAHNFQLIIISHDKTFLEVLQRIDKAEYYYRISRNYKGRSRIEKLSVHGNDGGQSYNGD